MLKLLKKLDIGVQYNTEQTCCGQIAFNSGEWDVAQKLALKFLNDFHPDKLIVSPSASCSAYLRNYYSKLFKKESDGYQAFQKIGPNIIELSDFLVNHLHTTDFGAYFPHTVTYHDSCSGLREYHLKNEGRILLNQVKGLKLIEMDETHECCGFGGTFAVKHKYISQAMVEQKVEHAIATNADFITSTEVSCLMNIDAYVKKQKLPLKAVHFSDILVSGW